MVAPKYGGPSTEIFTPIPANSLLAAARWAGFTTNQVLITLALKWYADDACAGGDVTRLRQWWKRLCEVGPHHLVAVQSVAVWPRHT